MVKYGVKDCQKSHFVCHFVCHNSTYKLHFGIKQCHAKRLTKKIPSPHNEGIYLFQYRVLFIFHTLDQRNMNNSISTTGTIHRTITANRHRLNLIDTNSRESGGLHTINKNQGC